MSLEQDLSKAIQSLARGTQVTYDRTLEMVVSGIDDVDTGSYRVSMEGNVNIPAVAIEGLRGNLSIGDRVLVKVPNGDLSSISDSTTNLIEYKIRSSTDTTLLDELMNSYQESGVKLSDIYEFSQSDPGLIAGKHDTNPISVNKSAAANNLFQAYASNYDYLRVSARFKTALNDTHTKGIYGLKAIFKDRSGNDREYTLGFDAFVGTPYNYMFFNTQDAIFDVSADDLAYLDHFEFFEQGFEFDHIQVQGEEKENDTIPNIFIDSIEVAFVDKLNLEPNSYYLYIQTPNGTILKDSTSEVELIGHLIYNTNELLSLDSCKCYWYKEDLSVIPASEDYDKRAGFGWKQISTENTDRIKVSAEDVATTSGYKLVVIYNDKVTSSATTMIARYESLYSFEIHASVDSNGTKLQLVNNKGDETLLGNWYVTLPTGSYSQLVDGKKVNEVSVNQYLIYSFATFSCEVLDPSDDTRVIGTATFTLSNDTSRDDILVTFIGQDLYHYDANGKITVDEADEQRMLQASVQVTEGKSIKSKKWLWSDGTKITTEPYSPDHSMMENIRVDWEGNIYYNIKKTYRANFINNSLKVNIVTYQGDEYTYVKDFTFLKDGDQGTNGSPYSVVIRPYDRDNKAPLSGFQALQYKDDAWGDVLYLTPYVYREDELVAAADYQCVWSVPNSLLNLTTGVGGPTFPHVCSIQGTNSPSIASDTAQLEYWVKATVTVGGETIYTQYPVNVVLGELEHELDISSVMNYIKYSASGRNPEYQNTEINITYNRAAASNVEVLTNNLLSLSSDKKRLYPVSEFNYFQTNSTDSHIGIVAITPDAESATRVIHPIVMYLNTYGNEAINSWDGTQLEIDTNRQYILAPQIGAGKKEADNTFTGVVMGENKGGGDDLANKVGLYGYQKGVASFGLLDDGTAFFGQANSGGRIKINGKDGVISGGTYDGTSSSNTNGMYITLANKDSDDFSGSTKAIGIGYNDETHKEKFYVQYDGTVYAEGTLTAGAGSKIGPWNVANNQIYLDGGKTYFGTNGIQISNTNGSKVFSIDNNGNTVLTGNITWEPGSSPTQALYATSALTAPTAGTKWNTYPATSTTAWHRNFTSGDQYVSYTYDGGNTWGNAIQAVGKKGDKGDSGDPLDVNYDNIKSALQLAHGTKDTFITADAAGAPTIYGGNIYGAKIYAGNGDDGYLKMDETGIDLYTASGGNKAVIGIGYIGYQSSGYDYPFIILGRGVDASGTDAGMIKKYSNGIWIGDNDGQSSSTVGSGTGLFINFNENKIYKYLSGQSSEIGTAVFI